MTLRLLAEISGLRRPGYGRHVQSWTSGKEVRPSLSQRNHAGMYYERLSRGPSISASESDQAAAEGMVDLQTLKHRKRTRRRSSGKEGQDTMRSVSLSTRVFDNYNYRHVHGGAGHSINVRQLSRSPQELVVEDTSTRDELMEQQQQNHAEHAAPHIETTCTLQAPRTEIECGPVSHAGVPMPTNFAGHLPATKPGQKPRIVVLGTGWAASRLMKDLNTSMCDIVCVSPRNHMVFTPLLASTCVGTLEFRSVAEPIVRIQPALSESPDSFFFLGRCLTIDPQNHEICCIAEDVKDAPVVDSDRKDFTIAYDKLVIAAGAQALTFNIRGVKEHAIFLREVTDAQTIRKKLLLNLMLSDIPGTSEEEKRRLLHCVVVGGGPTGVEFSGELSDFIRSDVHQRYSHVKDYINVTLIEAKEILSSFDVRLRLYAIKHLEKAGVKLVQGVVKDVEPEKIILSDGSVVPYGVLVWSTGVGPSGFVKSLELPKSRVGRIGVDEKLRVPGLEDVYAIGDCAGFVESVGKPDLPALAQVAERQGKYLAKELNRILKAGGGRAGYSAGPIEEEGPPFVYKHLGSMASVGRYKALVDLRENKV